MWTYHADRRGTPSLFHSHTRTHRNCYTESWEKFDPVPTDIAVCLSIFIFPVLRFHCQKPNSVFRASVFLSRSLSWILWSDNLCKTCSHAVEFLTLSIACFEFPPFLFYNHSDIKKYTQLFTTINPATISNNAMQENISQASWEMKRKVCEKSQREFQI